MRVYCKEFEMQYGFLQKIYLEVPNSNDVWYQEVLDGVIYSYFDQEHTVFPMKWLPYNVTVKYEGWYDGEDKNTFTLDYSIVKEKWKSLNKIITYKEGNPINIKYEK